MKAGDRRCRLANSATRNDLRSSTAILPLFIRTRGAYFLRRTTINIYELIRELIVRKLIPAWSARFSPAMFKGLGCHLDLRFRGVEARLAKPNLNHGRQLSFAGGDDKRRINRASDV